MGRPKKVKPATKDPVKELGPTLSKTEKASGKPTKFGQVVSPRYDPEQNAKFGNPSD